MARRPADPRLVPIRKLDMFARLTHGGAGRTRHRECWKAETVDGVWVFDRLEQPGTPWDVWYRPLGLSVTWEGTLRACRLLVGSGAAERALPDRVRDELRSLDEIIAIHAKRLADMNSAEQHQTGQWTGISPAVSLAHYRERRDLLLAWQRSQARCKNCGDDYDLEDQSDPNYGPFVGSRYCGWCGAQEARIIAAEMGVG